MRILPTTLSNLLDLVRSSLWFLPMAMLAGAAVLARTLIAVDEAWGPERVQSIPGVQVVNPATAQTLLSTLAGSMITITGVVFSITVVTLTLASSQFGPRLLRSFMRDRVTQLSLGTFLSTFLFCLLVLVSIGARQDGAFVPHLSVAAAAALSVASVGVMAFFIHHVAQAIQVSNVIASVSEEFHERIDALYPEGVGGPAESGAAEEREFASDLAGQEGVEVVSEGYVRLIKAEVLMELAEQHDLRLHVLIQPGDFVVHGIPVVRVASTKADGLSDDLRRQIGCAVVTGNQRTTVQDVGFSIDQLVELAQRALSPGINDPRTAVSCVQRLGQGLARLGARTLPSRLRLDDEGHARMLTTRAAFEDLADSAFRRVARAASGGGHEEVMEAVDATLAQAESALSDPRRVESVARIRQAVQSDSL